MNTKQTPSKVRLRHQKAILEAELRGQSLTPSEHDVQSVLDAIHALSLPEEEKRILFQFFDPNEPPPEREVDYWEMEDRMHAVCRNLPETPESVRFGELVRSMVGKALAYSIATDGWRESNERLRRHYEEKRDSHALGAVVGAIKAVDGPSEDPASIPEEWIRRGISKAAHENRRIPTEGSGRPKMSSEKREQIIADCLKWRPICEGLNNTFKQVWEEPEYTNSEVYRKEARGGLVEKFRISAADVQAIEWSLRKPARHAKKSTPTEAMCHIVARLHGIAEKTVEKLWLDYLQEHPDERRRKRKAPTTPAADERTA